MSILINESYSNPTTPIWVSKVVAGEGVVVSGTDTNPIVSVKGGGVLNNFVVNTPSPAITLTGLPQSLIGSSTVSVKTLSNVLITTTVRMVSNTGTTGNVILTAYLGGTNLRNGPNADYDYTTTGTNHWITITNTYYKASQTAGDITYNLTAFLNNGTGSVDVHMASMSFLIVPV